MCKLSIINCQLKSMSVLSNIDQFREAQKYIPGGVNSPVRAFHQLKREPVFMKHAKGAYIWDVEGKRYTDYCLSWGVSILGHAYQPVVKAAIKAVKNGSSFGTATENEWKLAQLIIESIPSVEKIRFVNSGTEAVMGAIRLARAYTNRKIIVKFDGCYHGHSDSLLVSAGSGVANLESSTSLGVPNELISSTISIPFNDPESLKSIFEQLGQDIAAVIIEPVAANMGIVLPIPGFLALLRELTSRYSSLLIFDEVITGFRYQLGGIQDYFQVKPDLTILGKIIGGGFPVGAFGGKKEIMDLLAPIGGVYQAGTLSGNPVAMAAGIATISELKKKAFYTRLNHKANSFVKAIDEILLKCGVKTNQMGSMFSLILNRDDVKDYNQARKMDHELFVKLYNHFLNRGIYLSPSSYETHFISASHTNLILEKTLETIKKEVNKLF